MRKTNEGISVLTALEKAEQKLSEAIEMAKYERKETKDAEKNEEQLPKDKFNKEKDLKSQEEHNYGKEEVKQKSKEEKKIGMKIDASEPSAVSPVNQHTENKSKGIQAFFDVKFEDSDFSYKSILSQSEDYEIQSFNEIDLVAGHVMEVDDIMPSSFMLESFSDDYEVIQPYAINRAMLTGKGEFEEGHEENKNRFVSELLEKALAEAENVSILDKKTNPEREGEFRQKSIAIVEQAKKEANQILETANTEALKIKEQAELEAQRSIEEKVLAAEEVAAAKGYLEGFEKGQNQGYIEFIEVTNQQMVEEAKAFKLELEQTLQDFEERKIQLLEDNLNELTNLALTVAEKIVKISLKSSKDVISKLIVAAAEDCRSKEWAKVYISNEDKALTMNLEKELVDVLKQISPNIKVVVMEGEPSGTCIIETPDQIIDASVNVQFDAIKQIVNDNEL